MKILTRAILFFLMTFLIFICTSSIQEQPKLKILYVPLDERPVNLSYVIRAFEGIEQVDLLTSPKEYLPQKNIPADVDAIWNWIFDNCSQADYIILSADTLIYGSLTTSRLHHLEMEDLNDRLYNFDKLREMAQNANIFVFSTVMHTPRIGGSTADIGYYDIYGDYIFKITEIQSKDEIRGLSLEEKKYLENLMNRVPKMIFDDWISRRDKNLKANLMLLEKTKAGSIDYFILCRDDTAEHSQSVIELKKLLKNADYLTADQFITFSGADEVGLMLLTRAINEWKGKAPSIYVDFLNGSGGEMVALYEDQILEENINGHITAACCTKAKKLQNTDIVLIINTRSTGTDVFYDTRLKVDRIESYLKNGYKVAIADVAFPNGADNELMFALVRRNLLDDLTAYAGWNTAGNTIGYAVCQAVLTEYMPKVYAQNMILTRILDDWVYQANVRREINGFIETIDADKNALSEKKNIVTTKTEEKMMSFMDEHINCFHINDMKIDFPFDRTFEIDVEVCIEDS